ncbi:MAG: PIN domain-containing protein [Gammaproteobacteria bacterium]
MIGLDTNVLVRYLAQDDRRQALLANRVIEAECTAEEPGFISHVVLCELTWVLKGSYKTSKPLIVKALRQLLETKQLTTQEPQVIWQALAFYEHTNVDFADAVMVVINGLHGCSKTVTFDRLYAKLPNVVDLGAQDSIR